MSFLFLFGFGFFLGWMMKDNEPSPEYPDSLEDIYEQRNGSWDYFNRPIRVPNSPNAPEANWGKDSAEGDYLAFHCDAGEDRAGLGEGVGNDKGQG